MTKPMRSIFVPVLIMLAMGMAFCAKEVNYTDPEKKNPVTHVKANFKSLASFAQLNMPLVQSFQADASKPVTVTLAQGSQLEIPAGSMMLNGVPVYSGSIKVQVRELVTRADMVKCGITTETESGILESAGMMEMQAEKDGQVLTINPLNPPWVTFDAGNNKVYSGFGAFTLNTNNKWEYNDAKIEVFANNGQFYFRMPIKKMGWINCDRFYNYKNTCDIKITVPEEFRQECKVYLVVHYYRSTLNLYWDGSREEYNVTSRGYTGLPDTLTVTAICESLRDGIFYAKDSTFKITPGAQVHLIPEEKDAEAYNESLNRRFD